MVNTIHNDDASSNRRDALSQLLGVTALMTADMRRGMARYGLTEARVRVLWELGLAENVTQRHLADALQVSPRNVTALVDGLEATGFVRRDAHPSDRRAVVVVPTPKGDAVVGQLRREMDEFAELLFGSLAPRELQAFRRTLQTVLAKLAELESAAR
jgi:DNA-binding MarR family transcriptional regulator